jgi:hypothetical protein
VRGIGQGAAERDLFFAAGAVIFFLSGKRMFVLSGKIHFFAKTFYVHT